MTTTSVSSGVHSPLFRGANRHANQRPISNHCNWGREVSSCTMAWHSTAWHSSFLITHVRACVRVCVDTYKILIRTLVSWEEERTILSPFALLTWCEYGCYATGKHCRSGYQRRNTSEDPPLFVPSSVTMCSFQHITRTYVHL